MQQFEFVHYGAFAESDTPTREYRQYRSDSAARSYAGRLAKRINGPVDVAFAGAADWDKRYLTTASPSDVHTSGYQFVKID